MIPTFYREEMVPRERVGFSQSPQKPKMIVERIQELGWERIFPLEKNWDGFQNSDFFEAHTERYVQDFFQGIEPAASSNGLSWNPEFADSVRYTNASLYQAIRYSYLNQRIAFSPTSGFHHATPDSGRGFCSFSGQVIASIRLWKEFEISGAYIDLDGHFGNSIEDSKYFVPELERAIPINMNPMGTHFHYFTDAKSKFEEVLALIKKGKIHYVVFCSGADSLVDDDMGNQLTLEEWLHLKSWMYERMATLDTTGFFFPTTITLFGGYRQDHYESVIDAHLQDLLLCLDKRFDKKLDFDSVYRRRKR